MRESVRLGCWAAFWGDTSTAVDQILDGSEVDYLVSDYLSEITMALLARARQRDPEAGFVPDAVRVIAPRLAEIRTRGIKVITNAGALNPVACAQAFRDAAEAAGVTLRVAAIEGDDLMPQLDALRDAGAGRHVHRRAAPGRADDDERLPRRAPDRRGAGGRCGHRRDGPQRRLVRRARAADARVRLAATRTTTCCRPARSRAT